MAEYPFNHKCQWRGPFHIWQSNKVDFEPPADSIPVWACCICGAHKPVEQERKP